ncbi:MAG: acetate--CoA ligase family protein [Halobacteriales archaeon]
MTDASTPDAADGEQPPTCPPRRPRFVDAVGRTVLVEPREPPLSATADGLAPVEADDLGPEGFLLAATVDGTVEGYARLSPAEDRRYRARVAIAPRVDGELGPELARQAVGHAFAAGADRLMVDGDAGPFRAAEFDPEHEDGEAAVALAGRDAPTEPLASPPDGPDLSGLFAPQTVAVVGATDREGSIGRLLLSNLEGYAGDVIPVTPRADEVFGRPAPDSLTDAGAVDLAVVAVPPGPAIEAVETAGRHGVDGVVVVSAGFGEAGDEEGARRLRDAAERHGVTLVGPNSMGVMSTATGLNATFSPSDPARGSVSLVSQSGAFITAAVGAASDRGLGFRHVVSVGNKAVLDETDLLRYLDADPGTDVVAAYLEDVADGEAFVETAREVTRTTPVVVLKAGRTEAGARAAASHTGSLAGNDVAVDAAFERAGVIRADSTEQLLDYAAALRSPAPSVEGVGVVTNAGGPGVLATDATSREGLSLAEFDADTRRRLDDLLPGAAAAGNPVDVLGDADAERFASAIEAVLGDPGVDLGVTVTTPHPLIDYADLVGAVARRSLAHDTPVVTSLMGGDLDADARRALRRHGVVNYSDPSRAAAAIDALGTYARHRDRPPVDPPGVDLDEASAREVVSAARDAGRSRLGVESLSLLEAAGVPVPAWTFATSPADAAEAAPEIGDEVVLKVASPDVAHKVDVGGVRTGVAPDAAGEAYEALLADVRNARPDAAIDGVVVQAAVDVDAGVETVVGASRSRFGPLLAFGLGGVLVEHVEDVAFELAPLNRRIARGMLESIDAAAVLSGARGRDGVDRAAVVDALVRVSALVEAVPGIAELDVNPLVATPDGVAAVDLQVELAREE